MTTRITDVIVPEIFNPYVINRTTELSALWQSGIIGAVPELEGKLNDGNVIVHMPFWNDLTGEDETLKDEEDWGLTPGKITSGKDIATQVFRGRAWATGDLAKQLSGDDPMRAIGDLVAEYWTRRLQVATIALIRGLFVGTGATLKATHVSDLSVEESTAVTDANKLNGHNIVDGFAKLGDAHEKLTGMIMHSVVYFNLVKQQLIEEVRDADGKLLYNTYMGKRVIVDDGAPTFDGAGGSGGANKSKKYMTILFGQGALGYVEGSPEFPTETDRDKLGGVNVLITRKHFILHPRGVKFVSNTVDDITPTNAELALNANWQKVYQDKQIRMVAIISNG